MSEKKFIQVEEDGYQVGYGKPPKHTQFKKGQSGNPGGRPPRFRFETDENPIRRYMLEMQTVNIGGKKVRMPAVDVIIKSMINKAMQGCRYTQKLLLEQSGGLTALREEWKRQKTKADEELIKWVQKAAGEWCDETKPKA